MKNLIKTYWPLFIIQLAVGFLFTFRLGRDLLLDWDECIYAGYATNMKIGGIYLHNMWNGLGLFEKSPFYSWILQLPLLAGRSELGLRLPTVLASLTLLGSIYVFCQSYFSKRIALIATLLMLTFESYIIYSTKVSTDVIFSLFIFSGFWTWISSANGKEQKSKLLVWMSGVFFAFALMVKGLGVTPYMGTLFLTIFLQPKKSRFLDFLKLLVSFSVVGLPWHLLMFLTHQKEFMQMYIVDNFYKRSTFPVEFHRERLWFYLDLLYKESFPWIFALFIAPLSVILNAVKDLAKRTKKGSGFLAFTLPTGRQFGMTVRGQIEKNSLTYTVFLFVLLPLISISRVQTRIAWYVIPLLPYLSIFLAICLNLILDFMKKKNKTLSATFYILLLIFIIFDAGRLILNETRFAQSKPTIDTRYEVILQSSKQEGDVLNYLVPFGERQAKIILPPDETLTNTWYYGGNACAVYYSNKKVNYFYELEPFEKALNRENSLFLISNQDSKYAEGRKILFKNADFTLFTFGAK